MNGILAKSSNHGANKSNRAQGNNKPGQSVETAGSLAMWQQSMLNAMMYDSFSSNNPFVVDYAAFGISPDTVAYSGFLNSFSNAMSVLGDSSFSDNGFGGSFGGGSFSAGGGFSGADGGSFSSTC